MSLYTGQGGQSTLHPDDRVLSVERPWYPVLKTAMDLTVALALLVVVGLLMLVIALLVKLESPGPILFRQARIGWSGRPFQMLKFRTMIPERRHQRGYRRRILGTPTRPQDARRSTGHQDRADFAAHVTRRAASADQCLRRDMSLVGPRPELPEIVARYEPWQHQRHQVRPGITGWWQVNRSGARLMHEDVAMDIYYVENRSLKLDLWILARTVGVVISGRGAF